MNKSRKKFIIYYQVLDDKNKTLDVIEQVGYNKNYIAWRAARLVKHKYGKSARLNQIKVEEIP